MRSVRNIINADLRRGVSGMINKKHFGKRISDFRRRIPLSQAELAEKMGVSAQAVSKWETGVSQS